VFPAVVQLFGPLRSFLAAARLLHEFEVVSISSIGGGKRQELVLKQQQAAVSHAHVPQTQQQQQQQQRLWQQQQLDVMVSAHEQQQLADQHWDVQQRQQVMYRDGLWLQGAAAAVPAAAAAASYDDCNVMDDADDGLDDEVPLVLEAVQALQRLRAVKRAVPMRAVMESTAAADGDDRSLFVRVGGSGAAAVAFLRRWPYVFNVHQVELGHPGLGGVRSGFQVQLQPGVLQWLLESQRFKRQLAGFRAALRAAVQKLSAEPQPGERRGVEVGKVGNRTPFGFMTPEVMPYRQVRGDGSDPLSIYSATRFMLHQVVQSSSANCVIRYHYVL
jgi:hypothetical protein